MDFVGYEVGSKETYWLDATTEEPVQLSNICLKSGGIAGEPLVLEMKERDTDRTAIICVLRPGVQENIKLNLLIQKAYGLTLAGGTKAKVQVAGYKLTLEDQLYDDEDEEDLLEDENDEGSEEEEGDSDSDEEDDEDSEEEDDDEGAKAIREKYEKKLAKLEKIEKELTAASEGKGKSGADTRKRKGADTQASPENENEANDEGSEEEKKEGDSDSEEDDDEEYEEEEDDEHAKAIRKKSEKKLAKLEKIEKELAAESEGKGKSEADTRKRKGAETQASPENKNAAKSPKPGKVRELPYGLKIQELLIGTGPRARHGHHVSCHYTLRLENGKKIDSSGKKPFRFRLGVGEVIKGWDNGLSGMRVGGERHIIVPSRLGYGSKSMGQIPRNSTLYFDVKLVDAQ
ncbi:hypothetical protein NDN08_003475 [Rhodosorus marinus]|uniref:peptidylprolyl isomerase n=1 Tax=Rhodosorus marinus TaxID=101924 RepID=A0AAV8V0A2_9RHOD|nr:hypothetical protein NDN08_003475 [Rhodosorus marinus]